MANLINAPLRPKITLNNIDFLTQIVNNSIDQTKSESKISISTAFEPRARYYYDCYLATLCSLF